MSAKKCPAGHASTEDDYCSVCGAAMVAALARPVHVAEPPRPAAPFDCPSCGEVREDRDARYCEVCRYDFVERRPGPPPVARPRPAARSPTPMPASAAAAPSAKSGAWELVVTVDATLDVEPDPETPCPTDAASRVFVVDRDLLMGRHDDQRDIHPDVPVRDPGTSRRHAKFVREADGGLALQDLASTNGTELNGKAVASGAKVSLQAGDAVTLGRWTRVTIRSAP